MTAARIKALVALALMVAALAVAHAWRPTARLADTRPKVVLDTLFPKAFGAWVEDTRMPVQLVSPDAQAVIDKIYNQTLSRTYVNPQGERIMLSVAYGGDQSDATRAHRPEVCYPAQGFQVLFSRDVRQRAGSSDLVVRQLVTQLGSRVEPVTYWIVVGEKTAITGSQQKLAQLSYSVAGLVPDGMLVRVSSINTNHGEGFALQRAFLNDLAVALIPSQHLRVFGSKSD